MQEERWMLPSGSRDILERSCFGAAARRKGTLCCCWWPQEVKSQPGWTRAGVSLLPPGVLPQAGGCSCRLGTVGSPSCCSNQRYGRLSREPQRRERGREHRKRLGCRADSVTDVAR